MWSWTLFLVLGFFCVSAQRRPPNYSQHDMPTTSFDCRDKIIGGYYADPETDCQMFHVCVKVPGLGVQDFKFLCPNDTSFDQENQICDDWYNIDCESSTLYYSDNFDLYRIGSNAPQKVRPVSVNNAVSDVEDDFYLQRKNDRGENVPKDLLRGSQSSNFFSNRGGKDEDDFKDDYNKSKKKPVTTSKPPVRKLLTGKRPVQQSQQESSTSTETPYKAPSRGGSFGRSDSRRFRVQDQSSTATPFSTTTEIIQRGNARGFSRQYDNIQRQYDTTPQRQFEQNRQYDTTPQRQFEQTTAQRQYDTPITQRTEFYRSSVTTQATPQFQSTQKPFQGTTYRPPYFNSVSTTGRPSTFQNFQGGPTTTQKPNYNTFQNQPTTIRPTNYQSYLTSTQRSSPVSSTQQISYQPSTTLKPFFPNYQTQTTTQNYNPTTTQNYSPDRSNSNYETAKLYKINVNAASAYDEPTDEFLKTAPSQNLATSNLNRIQSQFQKTINTTVSAGYNFKQQSQQKTSPPPPPPQPTYNFNRQPQQKSSPPSAPQPQPTYSFNKQPQQKNLPPPPPPSPTQQTSRGRTTFAQTTDATERPRPFTTTNTPQPTQKSSQDYDYAYYDDGTGSEYDNLEPVEEFRRTKSKKRSA